MIPRAKRRSFRAFTLIELLVVIGIISILVAVSFPYLRAALIKANIVKCSGNLHSIGVAMISFAGDNNGNLPESGGVIPYNGPADPNTGKLGWTQQLEPYIGTDKTVYQCPDGMSLSGNATYCYFNGAHAGYNSASTPQFSAVSLIKCRDLSRHIISGDIAFPGVFGSSGLTDADKDDYSQDPAFNGGTSGTPTTIPIHMGSANLLFGDGHVESAKYFDPTTMATVYSGVNPNASVYLQ